MVAGILAIAAVLASCSVVRGDEAVSKISDRIERVSFKSRALGASKSFCVVLPADFDSSKSDHPVLFLLHGRGRTERTLIDDPDTRSVLLRAPFVIVLPNGEDGWYLDSPVSSRDKYAQLLDETIREAESRYNLSKQSERRAIAGWSMGGFGAVRHAEAHSHTFAIVASILGLLDFPRKGLPEGQTHSIPEKTFGKDQEQWAQLNPIGSAAKLRGTNVLLITADESFDRTMNENFHQRLKRLHIEDELMVVHGTHHLDVVKQVLPIVINRVTAAVSDSKSPSILRTDRVWNAAPCNSFTDLAWFKDRFVLAFREGVSHGVPPIKKAGGALRILESTDGATWTSSALIRGGPDEDLRDAKLSITPDGRLMLSGAAAFKSAPRDRQSLAWFSKDVAHWSDATNIGDFNYWLWGTAWHNGKVYSVGYGPTNTPTGDRDKRITRLYRGNDGMAFTPIVASLTAHSGLTGGGETALLFRKDGTAVALSRRDTGGFESLIGTSCGDFTQWTWHTVAERTGGPELIELPDGRIVAASRRFVGSETTTALYWLDPTAGTLTHFLTLPSGGDTSYAGMVWHNDLLWVSYYSSHEGKSNIYVSQVQIPSNAPNLGADYNGDGHVDAADYVRWRKNAGGYPGYDVWRQTFGNQAGAAATASIPEPPSLALFQWAMLAALNRNPDRAP